MSNRGAFCLRQARRYAQELGSAASGTVLKWWGGQVQASHPDHLPVSCAWRRLALWIPPLVYIVIIFHLSSESDPLPSLTTAFGDKALHAIEYAGLAFLVCRALCGEGLRWRSALVIAILITSAYGASDEWHQSHVSGRQADILDWFADTTGAATGAIVYMMMLIVVKGTAAVMAP
jgi:VanZ family protein